MEPLTLTDGEQSFFSDLFANCVCDIDSPGKISLYRATELFKTSQLPPEVLQQITELCGATRLGHFGRSQFFLALKLIGAAQVGLPLRPDTFSSGLDIPLPKFCRTAELDTRWQQQYPPPPPPQQHVASPDLIQLSDTDGAPSLPDQKLIINSHLYNDMETTAALCQPESPDSENPKLVSPTISSTASDSPTPTNSIQEKNWVATHWHGLMYDEHRQLLGTEEESSDRHSSDEEYDIWTITDEQREYYTNQFKSMQPELHGMISGGVAKEFFEKSKLPVQELRKIWQLSDVTKDGALSLKEFYTAMHLVVLRRNNIELPDVLPPSLMPLNHKKPEDNQKPQEVIEKAETSPKKTSPTQDPTSPSRSKEWTKFVDSPTSTVSSPGLKPVNFDFQKSAVEQDPKILHPVAVRLTPESQMVPSSDDEVAQPVATRKYSDPVPYEQMSMDQQGSPKKALTQTENAEMRGIQRPHPHPKKPAAPGPGAIPPPPQSVTSPSGEDLSEVTHCSGSHSGPVSLPVSVPTNQGVPTQGCGVTQLPQGLKKEPPPPPPPRPYRSHARSSSLDLNRLGRSGGLLGAPPAVPPRASPVATSPKKLVGQRSEGDAVSLSGEQQNFADFTQFTKDGGGSTEFLHTQGGAFEVYRKPGTAHASGTLGVNKEHSPEGSGGEEKVGDRQRHISAPIENVTRPRDKRSLQSAIRQHKDRNTALSRLNYELNQELSEVTEERIALELQLEQMKPFTD